MKLKQKYNFAQTIRVARAGTRLTVHRSLYIEIRSAQPLVVGAAGSESLDSAGGALPRFVAQRRSVASTPGKLRFGQFVVVAIWKLPAWIFVL